MVPLDATIQGTIEVDPGAVEVRVFRDGQVVDQLSFGVEQPQPLPEDARTELLGALLMAPSVQAQFPGDLFFAVPSIAVAPDSTGTFEVLLFSGAQTVGATHFEVVFDPAQLETVAVKEGLTTELADGHVSVVTPGRVAVVNLNVDSVSDPIGTSSLIRLEVQPLAPVGTRIPLSIQVHSLLSAGSTPLPDVQGFSGELLVVSSTSSLTSATESFIVPGPGELPALTQRARQLRRPGQAVEILDFVNQGSELTAEIHRIVVPDPSAPTDEAP